MGLYEYRAVVTKLFDGDTVTVDVDLGWDVWLKDKGLRLNRINAPELYTDEDGPEAQQFIESMIPLGTDLIIKTKKDKTEKYGRMLAEIYRADDVLKMRNINDAMVKAGFALYWDGTGERPT